MTMTKRLCIALTALLAVSTPAMGSGVSPNVLVLPSGPGSIGGVGENVQANLNMGLMTYPINIMVPKGRGDATPPMGISYSSSAGAGKMGIGWRLSAGASIERLTVRGLPTYTNNDNFYAEGELVKIPKSPYFRARMEGGFIRYEWKKSNDNDQKGYWIAEYPNGAKGYFGANDKGTIVPDAQITGLKGTFKWELVTFVDRNGNRVQYSYTKSDSQTYLDQISWVFDTSGKALYQASFLYEKRPDPISDGKPGFDVQTKQRLRELRFTSDGQRFRSYTFTFEDATGLSRLIKVERFGRDPQTRFPIYFTMKYSNATFSQQNSRMVQMPTALGINFKQGNAEFIDMNGDGLPDVVNTSEATHRFFMNALTLTAGMKQDKHDFPTSLAKDNPKPTNAKTSNPSVQLLDFNGDGYTDLVDAVGRKIYINKGNSQWESQSESLVSFPGTQADPNIRFFDYNGDKKIDIIRSDGKGTSYWVNDGKGSWQQVTGNVDIGKSFSADKLRLIDINGDGLQDVVHITSSSLRYRKYLGYGEWSGWIDMSVPGIDKYALSKDAQFADMNGDGLADMVAFLGTSIVYFVNKNGMEFEAGKELKAFGGVDIPDSTQSSIRIADMNGNGSRDIVWIDSSGKVTYLELFSKRPNLMTEISNNIGQRINVEYGSSVFFYLRDKDCKVGSDKACAGPWKNKLPMPFTVVTKITTWASRSDAPTQQVQPSKEERPQVQSIYYHSGFYDGIEKKFRGFRHVETLFDGDSSVGARKDEIKYNVGDTDSYMHGKLLERTITDGAGLIYQQMRMEYNDCPVELGGVDGKTLSPPIRFVCQNASEKDIIEGKPNAKRTIRSETVYDGFGNPTIVRSLGEKSKDGDEKITKTTYIIPKNPNAPTAKWLLRLPQKIEYCNKDTGPCAPIEMYYDGEAFKGLPLGEFTKGNLTRSRVQLDPGGTTFTNTLLQSHGKYGNLIGNKTAGGQERKYTYDDRFQRFPTKEEIIANGNTFTATTRWDFAYSRVIESQDLNGQIQRYTYDSFGRISEIYTEGDTTGKPSKKYTYSLNAPISTIKTETRDKDTPAINAIQIKCFDGLGRTLSTITSVGQNKWLTTSHIEYNRLGLTATFVSRFTSDDKCRFKAPTGNPTITYEYDGLRRLRKQTTADGAFQTVEYEPFKRIASDEEDNDPTSPHHATPTVYLVDGLGRTIEEQKQLKSGNKITTKYHYNNIVLGGASLLKSVTFADGSQKQHEYNLLGKLTKVIDPDRSTTTYTYNKDNMPSSKTDGRGIKMMYEYDQLKRLAGQWQDGKPETKISYTYDKPAAGMSDATFTKSRLSSIKYPGGSLMYSYNERGQISRLRRVLAGVAFDFAYTRTQVGSLNRITYPNGTTQEWKFDRLGRIVSVPGKLKELKYNDTGHLGSWVAFNGVTTTRTFDAINQLTKLEVGQAGSIFTLEYGYNKVGNITSWKQQHGEDQFKHAYAYDALYRLTQADLLDNKEIIDIAVDNIGNLQRKTSSVQTSISNAGSYKYDPTKIHAATEIGKQKLSYNKGGYLTKQGEISHTWDFMGRQVGSQKGGKNVLQMWYGHNYRRTIKKERGLHTFYITSTYEIREGAVVKYITLGADRVVGTWSVKGVASFFDDLAPATGTGKALKAKPDGAINAADAWLYHANRQSMVNMTTKQRPGDLDLTNDMLMSSVNRMLLGADKEVSYVYHGDHLGSTRAITDANGKVVQRTHYYPYGAVRTQTGNKSMFSFGFQGSELDTSTQMNYFGVRSLNTRLARWLSPDPAFVKINGFNDEFNSYGMVLNNPIGFRDIDGTSSTLSGEMIGAIAGGSAAGLLVVAVIAVIAYRSLPSRASSLQPAAPAAGAGGYNSAVAQRIGVANGVTPGGDLNPGDARGSISSADSVSADQSIERRRSVSRSASRSVSAVEMRRVSFFAPPPPLRLNRNNSGSAVARPETPGGGTTAIEGEPDMPAARRSRNSSAAPAAVEFGPRASFAQIEGGGTRRRSSIRRNSQLEGAPNTGAFVRQRLNSEVRKAGGKAKRFKRRKR